MPATGAALRVAGVDLPRTLPSLVRRSRLSGFQCSVWLKGFARTLRIHGQEHDKSSSACLAQATDDFMEKQNIIRLSSCKYLGL